MIQTPSYPGQMAYGNSPMGGQAMMPPGQQGYFQGSYGYPPQPMPQGRLAGLDPGMMSADMIFNALEGIYVKQQLNLMQLITGCDFQQTFHIFELGQQGQPLRKVLLECKETSDCFARNCEGRECRSIDINISKIPMNVDYMPEIVFRLTRPCQCSLLCCNRPELSVHYVERGQNIYLGKIREPWACCNKKYEIFDSNDKERFFLNADCCQLGLIMQCPCENCQRVEFKVWSGPNRDVQEPDVIKVGAGNCLANSVTSLANFQLPFSRTATWQDKALLMAAALMIDYLEFQEKPQQNNNAGF